MRAIVQKSYGPPTQVLSVEEVPTPEPAEGEVTLWVRASSVNKADWFAVSGRPWFVRTAFGLLRPKHRTPGRDVAGVVEEVGTGVTRFAPGDEVVGELEQGAWSGLATGPQASLAVKPAGVTFEDAATLPVSAVTALQGLRDHGRLAVGETVLVNGASGNVGTFAVQVAKALGATVTAVCSTRNVETAKALGADHVVDYTTTDFTASEQRYDLVFDIAASRPLAACRRLLTPTGRYVLCNGDLGRLARVAFASMRNRSVVGPWVASSNPDDLGILMDWIGDGTIEPFVERTIGLEDVAEAVRDQGEGHGRGKTVVRI